MKLFQCLIKMHVGMIGIYSNVNEKKCKHWRKKIK